LATRAGKSKGEDLAKVNNCTDQDTVQDKRGDFYNG